MDDLRESPAVEVVQLLQAEGARVKAWEPFKPDANIESINMASSLDDALKNSDATLLLVRHTEFVNLAPADIASKTKGRIIIDTVNGWNVKDWQSAGFTVSRLGVRK